VLIFDNSATKESRDFMIAAISLGTVSAARSSCQTVGYWELVQGGIGCPDGDHTGLSYKRDALASVPFKDPSPEEEGDSRLEARIGDGAVDKPERSCRYRTNMCAGPKSLCSLPHPLSPLISGSSLCDARTDDLR
jgi:hypothetical protein